MEWVWLFSHFFLTQQCYLSPPLEVSLRNIYCSLLVWILAYLSCILCRGYIMIVCCIAGVWMSLKQMSLLCTSEEHLPHSTFFLKKERTMLRWLYHWLYQWLYHLKKCARNENEEYNALSSKIEKTSLYYSWSMSFGWDSSCLSVASTKDIFAFLLLRGIKGKSNFLRMFFFNLLQC